MRFLSALLGLCVLLAVNCQTAFALASTKENAQSKIKLQQVDSLPDVVRQTLALHFGELSDYKNIDELARSFVVPKKYRRPAGLFVTLSHKGKTRACWGSLDSHYPNLMAATVYTTEAALRKEYRFKQINSVEWQFLKPQVSVIRGVEPITSIAGQNALAYGLMVRQGNKAAVVLPGEASDAYYQLMICKVKAGIPSKQRCQIYRIKADVFK
ncbi:MAG TPA: AMMECR1 domain-containing protein [Drouetiella sp.]